MDIQEVLLREAVVRLKQALGPGGRLSEGAREEILSLASQPLRQAEKATKGRLLAVSFRWGLAACLPLALLAGFGTLMLLSRDEGQAGRPTLAAHKVGDQVIFTIANGSKVHYVYRSTDPRRFDPSSAVRVEDGRFQEQASNGADIVFYRVD